MSFECIIITAGRNEGKTSRALELVKNEPAIKGYVSVSDDNKESYDLFNLETGERKLLMKKGLSSDFSIGPFGIVEETFCKANKALITTPAKVILIDEVGRLELEDGGFHPSLSVLAKRKDLTLVLSIRDIFLVPVLKKYGIGSYTLLTGSTLESVSMPFSVPL